MYQVHHVRRIVCIGFTLISPHLTSPKGREVEGFTFKIFSHYSSPHGRG